MVIALSQRHASQSGGGKMYKNLEKLDRKL